MDARYAPGMAVLHNFIYEELKMLDLLEEIGLMDYMLGS